MFSGALSGSSVTSSARTLPGPDPELLRYVRRLSDLRERPTPAVLDTDCVRTRTRYEVAALLLRVNLALTVKI